MTATLDECIEQIATLTETVTKLQDNCCELRKANKQLLRQINATNTKLALVQRALEQEYEIRINESFIAAGVDTTELETFKHVSICEPTQRIPHRSRSADGNTVLRKLRYDLEASQLEKQQQQ
jgi:hypothetical protein